MFLRLFLVHTTNPLCSTVPLSSRKFLSAAGTLRSFLQVQLAVSKHLHAATCIVKQLRQGVGTKVFNLSFVFGIVLSAFVGSQQTTMLVVIEFHLLHNLLMRYYRYRGFLPQISDLADDGIRHCCEQWLLYVADGFQFMFSQQVCLHNVAVCRRNTRRHDRRSSKHGISH